MNKIKYFRRRQFVLGPEFINYNGWNRHKISGKYCLTVHPDLGIFNSRESKKSITLLGYIIDPFMPERNELEIINNMMEEINNLEDIIAGIERMSGRFVLIVELDDNIAI